MDDTIFTESVFESPVYFAQVVEPTLESPSAARMSTFGGQSFLKTAVASSVLTVCVLGSAAVSQNVIHPSAILVNDASERVSDRPWWANFDERIKHLLALPAGWEPGASVISEVAANAVRATLEKAAIDATPNPAVVPTVDGGIQVEWHQNGVDLEVRATPDGEIFAYFMDANEEREIRVRKPRQVRRWLRHLTADVRSHA